MCKLAWSAPSAIGTAGLGVGGQAGAEMTDFLIVLNSESVSCQLHLHMSNTDLLHRPLYVCICFAYPLKFSACSVLSCRLDP